jgi:hypothetical protein
VRANEASFDVECEATWVPNSCNVYYTCTNNYKLCG